MNKEAMYWLLIAIMGVIVIVVILGVVYPQPFGLVAVIIVAFLIGPIAKMKSTRRNT